MAEHTFAQVPSVEIPRSSFSRDHGHKTTLDAGWLVPIFVDEALPGDTFSLQMHGLGRLSTAIHPFMDNLYFSTFFFAVPYRLVWQNWERFNGAQDNPGDSTDYLIPQMVSPSGGYVRGSLSDYFGLPTGVTGVSHSALWHRAYNLIWNEWFRDQNLQERAVVDLDDGPDNPADYILRRRAKRHDYFTSSLPWPQKGDSVNIPLGGEAPVLGIAYTGQGQGTANVSGIFDWNGSVTYPYARTSAGAAPGQEVWFQGKGPTPTVPNVRADLSEATAATINQLRQAFQVQRMLERDARGGTRYTELVKSHFGVTSDDARLQRPEYLGGSTTPMYLHTVPSTVPDNSVPQANLSAYGMVQLDGGSHGFTKSFTEHCLLIGLVSVRSDLSYQQGMNRMWNRRTRYDFYWPTLSHIGEQAVLSKEIYVDGTSGDESVFGYQERYGEYRYKQSLITGALRSTDATPLDTWHLAQEFATRPLLNATFIQENPPVERVVAVTDEPHFIFDAWFQLRCARPMPLFGVPGMLDHF